MMLASVIMKSLCDITVFIMCQQCRFRFDWISVQENIYSQVAFQSNANQPLAGSMGYIKFEEM